MGASIKEQIRNFPFVGPLAVWLRQRQLILLRRHPERGRSVINLLESLPVFVPISGGTYAERAAMSVAVANDVFPALNELASLIGLQGPRRMTVDEFVLQENQTSDSGMLRALLIEQGSDKGTTHDYHRVYEALLHPREGVRSLLEIGLGTVYKATSENLGVEGKPGASLRAFRDYLPEAKLFGADIDRQVLFSDDRISTYFVDQTDTDSLADLNSLVPDNLDVVIDDGLHAVHANVNTLMFGLSKVAVGGFVVVEDINPNSYPVWQLVGSLLMTRNHNCWHIQARRADMFVVQRTE